MPLMRYCFDFLKDWVHVFLDGGAPIQDSVEFRDAG